MRIYGSCTASVVRDCFPIGRLCSYFPKKTRKSVQRRVMAMHSTVLVRGLGSFIVRWQMLSDRMRNRHLIVFVGFMPRKPPVPSLLESAERGLGTTCFRTCHSRGWPL